MSTFGSSVKEYSAPQPGTLSSFLTVISSDKLAFPFATSLNTAANIGSFITLAAENV